MPIKIEITGEHVGDIRHMLDAFNAPDPRIMPLADLLKITQERFGVAGFVVKAEAQGSDPSTPIGGEKVTAIEQALTEPLPEAEVVPIKRKRKAKEEAPVQEAVPAVPVDTTVRAYVLDELTKRFADPKQKTQAKAFIDKVAGRHGGVRLSRLDPEHFPGIREEMIAEFGMTAGSNGHAG